jgi:hypothetical protein
VYDPDEHIGVRGVRDVGVVDRGRTPLPGRHSAAILFGRRNLHPRDLFRSRPARSTAGETAAGGRAFINSIATMGGSVEPGVMENPHVVGERIPARRGGTVWRLTIVGGIE